MVKVPLFPPTVRRRPRPKARPDPRRRPPVTEEPIEYYDGDGGGEERLPGDEYAAKPEVQAAEPAAAKPSVKAAAETGRAARGPQEAGAGAGGR